MTDKMREMLIRLFKLAIRASHNAQEENRRLGIPNVFAINGIMVYEYDNKISMTPPPEWEKFDPSKAQKKSKSRCLTHRLFHSF